MGRTAALVFLFSGLTAGCTGVDEDPKAEADTELVTDTDSPADSAVTGPSAGACCLVDASCRDTMAAACGDLGGAFSDSSTCAEHTCAQPTRDHIATAGRDLELAVRDHHRLYRDVTSTVGREYWDLNGIDPALTQELLGREGSPPDRVGDVAHDESPCPDAATLAAISEP